MSALTLRREGEEYLRRQWVTVAQLAAATSQPKRTIQWACMHGDLQHCHRYEAREGGGPSIIKIDLVHAPEEYRLAIAKRQAEEAGAATLKLTEAQLAKATAIATLIQEVDAHLAALRLSSTGFIERRAIADFLAIRRAKNSATPSIASYYRYREKWLASGKKLVALADQRSMPGKGVKAEFDDEAFDFFCTLYLVEAKPTAKDCYRQLVSKATKELWQVPSLKTLLREVERRVPLKTRTELREGPTARARLDAYIERDWTKLAGNEFWVSDHCQFDILAYDDLPGCQVNPDGSFKIVRMWLTTWMDERSRDIMNARVHRGPNAAQVMASFYYAILASGVPQNIRIDNGKDYRCSRFAGGRAWRTEVERVQLDETAIRPVLMSLGITPHFTIPYNAKAKIVEPWHHHWIHEKFDRHMPGYCGTNSQERPEGLAAIVKSGGLMKWSEILPLFAQFLGTYRLSCHGELGAAPAIVRQQTLLTKVEADPRALAYLFVDKTKLMIRNNGIELNGCSYGIGNPDIASRQGEHVLVRWEPPPASIGRIWVYEPNGRFICTAENNGLLDANATHDDVVEANKRIKRHNRMAEEMAREMPVLSAINPAEKIALQRQYAEMELEKRGGMPQLEGPAYKLLGLAAPTNLTPGDSPGANSSDNGPIPFRAPSSAPSNTLRIQGGDESEGRTDSPELKSIEGATGLPANILDVFSAE